MCTIVALKGRSEEHALVVAANRDEFYSRRAVAPRRVHEAPVAVAGIDVESGGTWMGANAHGVFVALTNQRQYEPPDPDRTSRGEIVFDALAEVDVSSVDLLLETVDGREYNGFNLMYGDASELRVAYARPDRARIEIESLGDGVWVLPNDRIGSPDFPKARRAHALADPLLAAPWEDTERALHALLADHERPPIAEVPPPPAGSRFTHEILLHIQSLCVHTPVYGTRSSTVLALGRGRVERYLYADGPPCTAAFDDLTHLFG